MDIEEIFPGGEWKDEYEYVIRCPVCGDHNTHNHCHVNPTKGVFHCFYKGCSGSLTRLVKEYGGGVKVETRKGVIEKKKYLEVDFDQFKKVAGVGGTLDRLAFTYLKDRGVTKDEINKYDIRYATYGRYYGRVLFPIYEDGRLVNFVGRSFLHFIKPPYLFPFRGETLLTHLEAIFGYDRMCNNLSDSLVITEGVFDAIAVDRVGAQAVPGFRSISILSKALSKGQLFKLLKLHKETKFYIMLDADAHEDALLIARRLNAYNRYVQVAFLTTGDPASIFKEDISIALEHSQLFSEELLVETLLGGKNGRRNCDSV